METIILTLEMDVSCHVPTLFRYHEHKNPTHTFWYTVRIHKEEP